MASATGASFSAPIIVTTSDFRFIVAEQLQEVGIEPGCILIEPIGRDTAPAILAATLRAAQDSDCSAVLVMPSDHFIPDVDASGAAVAAGHKGVRDCQLGTFGIIHLKYPTIVSDFCHPPLNIISISE